MTEEISMSAEDNMMEESSLLAEDIATPEDAAATQNTPTTMQMRLRLTPLQRRLVDHLAKTADNDGRVRQTKRGIAKTLKCNEKTVDRAVQRLREEGWLEVVPQHLDNGAQVANAYRLLR